MRRPAEIDPLVAERVRTKLVKLPAERLGCFRGGDGLLHTVCASLGRRRLVYDLPEVGPALLLAVVATDGADPEDARSVELLASDYEVELCWRALGAGERLARPVQADDIFEVEVACGLVGRKRRSSGAPRATAALS
ncbi:MAG: hypothetical protein ACR2K6_02945 [Solirubrobacterales bacterium]